MQIPVQFQLLANPVAYTGNCFTLYQEFLQPLLVNYHLLVNYPQRLKQFPVQATGFASSWNCNGICISLYSFVHIDIYSVGKEVKVSRLYVTPKMFSLHCLCPSIFDLVKFTSKSSSKISWSKYFLLTHLQGSYLSFSSHALTGCLPTSTMQLYQMFFC